MSSHVTQNYPFGPVTIVASMQLHIIKLQLTVHLVPYAEALYVHICNLFSSSLQLVHAGQVMGTK